MAFILFLIALNAGVVNVFLGYLIDEKFCNHPCRKVVLHGLTVTFLMVIELGLFANTPLHFVMWTLILMSTAFWNLRYTHNFA